MLFGRANNGGKALRMAAAHGFLWVIPLSRREALQLCKRYSIGAASDAKVGGHPGLR